MLCIAVTFVACQKDEDVTTSDTLSQKDAIIEQFKNLETSSRVNSSIKITPNDISKRDAASATDIVAADCEDCDITFEYSSTTGGSSAQVTITDSSGVDVFNGTVTGGNTYTISINSCETYNVTTQMLVGTKANLLITDGNNVTSIPIKTNQLTFQNYSFDCPVDETVEECEITICLNYLQGSASAVHIGIFVDGNLPTPDTTFFNLQDGDCFTFTINENSTYEIKHIASNPSPDFAFSLQIDAPSYNLGFYMQGNFDTTGVINSRYLQCPE